MSSTIPPSALGTRPASAHTETTTVRSSILKQIRNLQKVEASLNEQLKALMGDPSTGAIQARIALTNQINAIEDQIHALQAALLQKEADRQTQTSEAQAAKAPGGGKPDALASGPAAIAAALSAGVKQNSTAASEARASAQASTPPDAAGTEDDSTNSDNSDSSDAALGSIIDVLA